MAIKTQGTVLNIETTRAATKSITAITNAKPPVVTATGHGYTNGQIVALQNILGMTQMNERAVVVANQTTNTFECKGLDSTLYGTYVSGGDSFLVTMTSVGTVVAIPSAFTGVAAEIKVTNLGSVAEEKIQGLSDPGDASFEIIVDNADVGQAACRAAKEAQVEKVFTIVLTDGKTSCVVAFVKSFPVTLAANEVARSTIGLTLRAAPSWFA